MKRNVISTSALVIALTLSPIATFPALAHETGMEMMESSPNAAKAPFDIQFLDTMAQHHREGIQMFQMAADKAESKGLRNKAQKMVDDQKKEISELKTMRDDIQANAPEAINRKLPGMMMMDMSKLESATGKDFDHHFLNMTIKHHQGALDMSKAELKSGTNQQVKEKAQMIIDMQTKEITEMKKMHDSMKEMK